MNNAHHSQYEKNNSKLKLKRTDTLRMTQEFNEKYFNEIRKNIETTDLYVMKDDIKNYNL